MSVACALTVHLANMPSNCSVFGCFNRQENTKGTNIKYHTFPKEKRYRDQWINACRRSDTINPINALICSVHFRQEDYKDDMKSRLLGIPSPKNKRLLKEDAVPSIHLPNGESNNIHFPLG